MCKEIRNREQLDEVCKPSWALDHNLSKKKTVGKTGMVQQRNVRTNEVPLRDQRVIPGDLAGEGDRKKLASFAISNPNYNCLNVVKVLESEAAHNII